MEEIKIKGTGEIKELQGNVIDGIDLTRGTILGSISWAEFEDGLIVMDADEYEFWQNYFEEEKIVANKIDELVEKYEITKEKINEILQNETLPSADRHNQQCISVLKELEETLIADKKR